MLKKQIHCDKFKGLKHLPVDNFVQGVLERSSTNNSPGVKVNNLF